MSFWLCSIKALVKAGCLWPSGHTAMPTNGIKVFISFSVIQPYPFAMIECDRVSIIGRHYVVTLLH